MSKATETLKGRRNYSSLTSLFDEDGVEVQQGARAAAKAIMEETGEPCYVNEQESKTILTSDGRTRKTAQNRPFYLSLSAGEQTIEAYVPEGWTGPTEASARLPRDERELIAQKAKNSLAALAEQLMLDADDEAKADLIRETIEAWVKRIPGSYLPTLFGEEPLTDEEVAEAIEQAEAIEAEGEQDEAEEPQEAEVKEPKGRKSKAA